MRCIYYIYTIAMSHEPWGHELQHLIYLSFKFNKWLQSSLYLFLLGMYLLLASPCSMAHKLYIIPSHFDFNLNNICHPVRSRIRDNKFNYIIFVVRFEQLLCSYQSTQLQYSLNRAMQYAGNTHTHTQHQRKIDVDRKKNNRNIYYYFSRTRK